MHGIGPYFPSITDRDWSDYEGAVSFELEGLLPFDGDGHWHICFDYRHNKDVPAITYIGIESDVEEVIAESFDEYLELLELDTEDQWVIETDLPVQSILNEIFRLAGIEFEDSDSFAHGYPIYRGRFRESWVWISPNRVPAGFIRPNEARYEELKSEMDVVSVRYPEIGESCLLISIRDDKAREELLSILTAGFLKIISLEERLSK